jgi:predicted adenylyl cyclase CyaB
VIEVELKARVADKSSVEARVASFASFEGAVDKLDEYWHGPDWRIQRGKKGFRVRSESGAADGRSVVTFKTKRSEGGIEINRESEFGVSDSEVFAEFALRLGCEPFYTKRKRGSRYHVDPCERSAAPGLPSGGGAEACRGAATIELVEVDGLGDFIEIEILLPDENPADVALAQGEIRGLLARAGLGEDDIEPRFYSELLMEAGKVARP